jgi:dTMP kinase
LLSKRIGGSGMLKRGLLIAFEGIDGAGKTTQANLLHSHLRNREFDVILSKEPTDSIYGLKIRKLAQGERKYVSAADEYKLFLEDRKIHVNNLIKPALDAKKIVILDRYYFSNVAYQGSIGLDPTKIQNENEVFSPIPEIVFLIKVPPRVGIRRIQKGRNENPNSFEKEDSLAKAANIYNNLCESYIVPVDGASEIDTIHKKIVNVIDDIIDHYLKKHEQYSLFDDCYKAML